jgi:hypothetical protein
MDDPTRRCENDTGICNAPSGVPGPKRGPHFFAYCSASGLSAFRVTFLALVASSTRSRLPLAKS